MCLARLRFSKTKKGGRICVFVLVKEKAEVLMLVLAGTYCEAGEDVRSSPHTDANHAVHPAEEQAVSDDLQITSQFMYIIIDRGHSLELSHHRRQHFSQLVHRWVTVAGDEQNKRIGRMFSGQLVG